MAIYSLHHSSIGKLTQRAPYTAAAHIRYITRERAVGKVMSGRMPDNGTAAYKFLKKTEDGLRKNGRVADKVMVALPRELTETERQNLVEDFAEKITRGRASWFAAIHDKGKDALNPHCHLVVLDRDTKTGKRVFEMSEKGSTEKLRRLWQECANEALKHAKRPERIDHRSLVAQGQGRVPTIHIGVRSRQLVRAGRRVISLSRRQKNHCLAKRAERTVDYPSLDNGASRFAFNVSVRRDNFRRCVSEETEADYWKAIDQDALLRDMNELRRLNAVLEYSDDRKDLLRRRNDASERNSPRLKR